MSSDSILHLWSLSSLNLYLQYQAPSLLPSSLGTWLAPDTASQLASQLASQTPHHLTTCHLLPATSPSPPDISACLLTCLCLPACHLL